MRACHHCFFSSSPFTLPPPSSPLLDSAMIASNSSTTSSNRSFPSASNRASFTSPSRSILSTCSAPSAPSLPPSVRTTTTAHVDARRCCKPRTHPLPSNPAPPLPAAISTASSNALSA
eukprot:1279731-Rhodomonas_salina.2